MKHTFKVVYELDTTVACAVAAYLDVEHYVFLHKKYTSDYEVVEHQGRRIKVKQTWRLGGLKASQYSWAEYDPPARFLNYEITSRPWWMPSVHQLIKTRTELRYYPDATGTKTVSDLTIEVDMPFWLWPLRHVIEKRLTQLKTEKDEEDIAMIKRREKIFGRGNIKSYLADHQFMLHKEDFVAHFGPAVAKSEGAASTGSPVTTESPAITEASS